DFSASVTQRNVTAPEPAVRPVRLAQALYILERLPGRQCRLELLDGSGNVVGMSGSQPTPVQPLLPGNAETIEKTLTDEISGSVRQVGPDEGGNCFDDGAQLPLALANLFFSAFAICHIGHRAYVLGEVSAFIKHRMPDHVKV